MKNHNQLINNIIGQLNGIKNMMADDKECFLVLTQLKAAKAGLTSLTNKYMQENFVKCLDECGSEKEKDEVCGKFFAELSKNN